MWPNSRKNSGFKAIAASWLVLLLLLPAIGAVAQIDIKTYTTETDTFYWKRYFNVAAPPAVNLKRYTASRRSARIDAFLATNPAGLWYAPGDTSGRPDPGLLRPFLYPVELTGDRQPDMIYAGPGEGGQDKVQIWFARNGGYDLVFEDYQYLSSLTLDRGILSRFTTGDRGTGTENYLYFTRHYRVDRDSTGLAIVREKQVAEYRHTEEPSVLFKTPAPFRTVADTLMLRASPARLNEPFLPDLDTFGNIVAKYRTRAAGNALAYVSRGHGNDWYYVEMSPVAVPSASILYGTDRLPTFVRGWVSAHGILLK